MNDIKEIYFGLPNNKKGNYIKELLMLGKTVYELNKLGIPRTSLERNSKNVKNLRNRFNKYEMYIDNQCYKRVSIPGYSRYLVSCSGCLFSLRNNTIFKPFIDKDGYEKVGLRSTIDKKRHLFGIHELVLKTFKGNPPENMDDPTVDHINGIRNDNRIENLRWLSRSRNSDRNHKHFKHEIQVNNRSISDKQVRKICELLDKGKSIEQISTTLKLKYNVVKSIKACQTFKYISKNYNFYKQRNVSTKIDTIDFYNLFFDLNIQIKDIKNKYNCGEKVIRSLYENLYDWNNCETFQI